MWLLRQLSEFAMAYPSARMSRTVRSLWGAAGLLFPAIAWANAGTPLMWVGAFHLFVGNMLIGLFEGSLLARFAKVRHGRAVGVMILANYLSAWLGGAVPLAKWGNLIPITIETLRPWFWGLVVVAFLVSCTLEWPLVRWACGPGERPWRRAWRMTLLVNGISYPLLFGGYWLVSGTGFLTGVEVVRPEEMPELAEYSLYYISRGGDVIERAIGSSDSRVIASLGIVGPRGRLWVRSRKDGGFDLMAAVENPATGEKRFETVRERFAQVAGVTEIETRFSDQPESMLWRSFGDAARLGPESRWRISTGFWSAAGISGRNSASEEYFRLSLETQFVSWPAGCATHLKGDLVVFQLGDDQVCLLDPFRRRIALLARGQGPVVALRPDTEDSMTANDCDAAAQVNREKEFESLTMSPSRRDP